MTPPSPWSVVLLAVEAERQIVTFFGKRNRGRGRQVIPCRPVPKIWVEG